MSLRSAAASAFAFCLLTTGVQASNKAEVLVQPVASRFPVVSVDINVRDAKTGAPVTGLSAADFAVFEDLKSADILNLESVAPSAADQRGVDFVFVFDDTGSMSEEIEGLIQRTLEFANIVQGSGFDYRFALVSFGDELNSKVDFTRSAEEFKKSVAALVANGGGDEPENALDALRYAATSFSHDADRRKVFVLITDAPFHSADEVTALTANDVLGDLAKLDAVLNVVGPNLDEYRWLADSRSGSFYDKDSGQFKRIIEQIAGGSASNYRLTLRTSRPDFDNTWRALDVQVKGATEGSGVSQYQASSWVSASSRADAGRGIDSRFAPHNLIDGNPASVWAEGVSGSGVGEWAALNFATPLTADSFALTLPETGAPQRVAVLINGEAKRFYDISPSGKRQVFKLPVAVQVSRFQVVLEAADTGDNGLAEIELYNADKLVEPIARAHDIRRTAKLALEQNRQGEQLYHAKKYDDAVFYYREALKNDPTYAQAYSNLGLAFQRQNELADAVWANRQAIALARGDSRATVLASSYYNIARIFETQNQYEQALQNFIWAKSNKENQVYDKAIVRMHERLGR
ncbi:VWA domain-containing protein [Pseudomonas sp. Gutcm_11s]|uniref:VWA domain-containing protein n=1 Tax=Pseudomonas sp. Gutcm_11s TaxID=3026088 RepID=UPI0023629F4E|nr:VWA domain-containing protein [Pseudomonas sp. Gutcm_11s]MDD0844410.1 VWA domain-containing protein [Pseudomonas sp. Gutcm_11s]